MSMALALEIAKIEAKEKISSTYFVLLHSEMYNLLEKTEARCLSSILNYGHDIGLHFDSSFYDIKNEKDLVKHLQAEKEFLEKTFNIKITSFAFHNPTQECLKYDKSNYAGMVNPYSRYFRKSTGYCSDSNGTWRYNRLEDFLKKNEFNGIQVLTHPVFWQKNVLYPKQKMWGSILAGTDKTLTWYDDLLKEFGRNNVAEHGDIFDIVNSRERKTGMDIEKNWISGNFETAFLLLWKFHQKITNSFLKKQLEIKLPKPGKDTEYFYNNALKLDLYKRFELVTGLNLLKISGMKYSDYKTLILLKDSILNAGNDAGAFSIKKGFASLGSFLVKLDKITRN